jgi:hypothetical protein
VNGDHEGIWNESWPIDHAIILFAQGQIGRGKRARGIMPAAKQFLAKLQSLLL